MIPHLRRSPISTTPLSRPASIVDPVRRRFDRWCLARIATAFDGAPMRLQLWDGTSVALSEIWKRSWTVPCGTRNEVPSWMLGNVSCGPRVTGAIALSNVLNDTVALFISVGLRMRFHVPTNEW